MGWNYQTTPFTIDPSARSTQTFAERYGISPPHTPLDDPYGANDYNGIEKDVDGGDGKTTVIKDTTQANAAHQPNSKRFLPNSSSFDVELIPVSQNCHRPPFPCQSSLKVNINILIRRQRHSIL